MARYKFARSQGGHACVFPAVMLQVRVNIKDTEAAFSIFAVLFSPIVRPASSSKQEDQT